jgi:hypothetical protein
MKRWGMQWTWLYSADLEGATLCTTTQRGAKTLPDEVIDYFPSKKNDALRTLDVIC